MPFKDTNLWMTSDAEQSAHWNGFLAVSSVPARAELVDSDLETSEKQRQILLKQVTSIEWV